MSTLVEKMQKTHGGRNCCFARHGAYLALPIGKVRAVDPVVTERLVKHLRAKHREECLQLLREDGVIYDDASGIRLDCAKFHNLFSQYCIVKVACFGQMALHLLAL